MTSVLLGTFALFLLSSFVCGVGLAALTNGEGGAYVLLGMGLFGWGSGAALILTADPPETTLAPVVVTDPDLGRWSHCVYADTIRQPNPDLPIIVMLACPQEEP